MVAEVHSASATLLINEPYAASFWVFVIGIGIVIPLIIHRNVLGTTAPLLVKWIDLLCVFTFYLSLSAF